MDDIIADRFLSSGSAWIDLASGAPVRLHLSPAGSARHQIAWSERCGAIARLRHPLLNTLLDYGIEGCRLFEAYDPSPPLRASGLPATRLLAHLSRFLQAHGVLVPQVIGPVVLRVIEQGASPRGRPLGIVLQQRRTLDAIGDVLRQAAPGGVTCVGVNGPRGSGLRTLVVLAARAARLEGFVPVSADVLCRRPWLIDALAERHVALFVDGSSRRVDDGVRAWVARFVVGLGAASARRHVAIMFGRDLDADDGLRMDRMGATAMRAMVYTDRECGPTAEALTEDTRAADGNPGALVARLGGVPFEPCRARFSLVRESGTLYVQAAMPPTSPASRGVHRFRRALLDAPERARRMAACGRHAAAIRLLARSARVLQARAENVAAARCTLEWGWILRARAQDEAALTQFEHARRLAGDSPVATHASAALGVAWSDAGRLPEAEALLRSARTAARMVDDTPCGLAATLALARCLLWLDRPIEAAAVLQPVLTEQATGEAWALSARIDLLAGEVARAAAAASKGVERARVSGNARHLAAACRAAVAIRAAIGDTAGAREAAEQGLRASASAHLPLTALRIRAAWLHALRRSDPEGHAPRLRSRIRAALRHSVHSLLRRQLEAACLPTDRVTTQPARFAELAQIEQWVELAQSAPTERAALQQVVDALHARLQATAVVVVSTQSGTPVVSRTGKPWGGEPIPALRSLASGASVFSTEGPHECAVPIRYGAETIGAVACRWAAGVTIDSHYAGAICSAAALAAAPALRALADVPAAPEPDATWADLLGTSASTAALRHAILNAARAPFPVLIQGESGSGKELVARAIHRLGGRRHRRLCTVNCAAISDELLEAELFGHTRGAFTGAVAERAGLFEEADGGSLFLDEVGELSGRAQAKLLRVLQDGEVRRVGENMPRRVDARVIAATNRRLEQEVEAGRFRADLRFRLDVIRIVVPSLRERPTDIPALVAHFWKDAAERVGSKATLAPETVTALTRYDWPGNVRELQNAVASLAVHGPRRGRITPGTLPGPLARTAGDPPGSFEAAREAFERRFVLAALAQAAGQRTRAARALGVSRQGLAKMLRRLRIEDGGDERVP